MVVVGGAFAGGFVSGLAGFGNGLVALGIWLHVLQLAPAATLVAICAVVAQAQTFPAIWHVLRFYGCSAALGGSRSARAALARMRWWASRGAFLVESPACPGHYRRSGRRCVAGARTSAGPCFRPLNYPFSRAQSRHAAAGLMSVQLGQLAILPLPGTVLGAWLGGRTYKRLSDRQFHQVVLALLGISGLTLILNANSG